MSEKIELKPCPFCGCEAVMRSLLFSGKCAARCGNTLCGAQFGEDVWFSDEEHAARRWNQRTEAEVTL
jgi:hypothetical protein